MNADSARPFGPRLQATLVPLSLDGGGGGGSAWTQMKGE